MLWPAAGWAGGRKSMFNGLADSIYAGTKHPDEAWNGSVPGLPACQNIVGGYAVVFPAIQIRRGQGARGSQEERLDVSPFTKQALDPNGTFLFPVADHAAEIPPIMNPDEEKINLGETTDIAGAYKQANDEVNALFHVNVAYYLTFLSSSFSGCALLSAWESAPPNATIQNLSGLYTDQVRQDCQCLSLGNGNGLVLLIT